VGVFVVGGLCWGGEGDVLGGLGGGFWLWCFLP